MSVRTFLRPSGVQLVLLDRPDKLNAINMDVVEGIREALERANSILVLGSTSQRAFSSGVDLDLSDSERAEVSDELYGLYTQMRETDTVIVVAANGYAIGGGAQLLIASDVRIVGRQISVRFLGPGHGLIVGAWGLASLVGRGRAIDLCLSMRTVGAEEAQLIGLVDRVSDDPLEEARSLAENVVGLQRSVISGIKRVSAMGGSLEALRRERESNSRWGGSMNNGGA